MRLQRFLHLQYSIPITHGTKGNSWVWSCSSVWVNIYGKQTISRKGSIKLCDDIFHLKYWNADSSIESRWSKQHSPQWMIMISKDICLSICNMRILLQYFITMMMTFQPTYNSWVNYQTIKIPSAGTWGLLSFEIKQ